MRFWLWGFGLVSTGVVAFWMFGRFPDKPTRPADQPPSLAKPTPAILTGTGSCSGRGCHGELMPAGENSLDPSRFSFSTWCQQDKHARAFQVLLEEPALVMARKLRLAKKPSKETLCLACHTNPLAAVADASPVLRLERSFEIGRASCRERV